MFFLTLVMTYINIIKIYNQSWSTTRIKRDKQPKKHQEIFISQKDTSERLRMIKFDLHHSECTSMSEAHCVKISR